VCVGVCVCWYLCVLVFVCVGVCVCLLVCMLVSVAIIIQYAKCNRPVLLLSAVPC
jgi:hypothetical protein